MLILFKLGLIVGFLLAIKEELNLLVKQMKDIDNDTHD